MTDEDKAFTWYIPDSGSILSQPSTLSYSFPDPKIVVPTSVFDELRTQVSGSGSVSPLLDQVVSSGTALFANPPQTAVGLPFVATPSQQDVMSLAFETRRQHPNDTISIVTDDARLRAAAVTAGLNTVGSRQLLTALASEGTADARVAARAREFIQKQGLLLLTTLASAASLAALGIIGIGNVGLLVTAVHVWWVLGLMAVGVAAALFWMRGRFRLLYGLTEFLFGLGSTVLVSLNAMSGTPSLLGTVVPVAGGLYVMVRGLDNLEKGIERTRFKPVWRRIFPRE